MEAMPQLQKQAIAEASERLQREGMRQFSVAATSGQGNRKERRRMQAELKKMMRKR